MWRGTFVGACLLGGRTGRPVQPAIYLFRGRERIIDFDTLRPNGAFEFRVFERQLNHRNGLRERKFWLIFAIGS